MNQGSDVGRPSPNLPQQAQARYQVPPLLGPNGAQRPAQGERTFHQGPPSAKNGAANNHQQLMNYAQQFAATQARKEAERREKNRLINEAARELHNKEAAVSTQRVLLSFLSASFGFFTADGCRTKESLWRGCG